MHFLDQMSHAGRDISRQIFIEVPKEICRTLRSTGFTIGLNQLSRDEAVEKVYKFGIWILTLISEKFSPMVKAIKQTLDVAYGTALVKNITDSFIDKKSQKFKFPREKIASTLLLTIGAACKFFRFFSDSLGFFHVNELSTVSNRMGQYRVFNYPVIGDLKSRPENAFIFAGCVASSIEVIYKNYQNYKNPNNPVYQRLQRERSDISPLWRDVFSVANCLKHTQNIGKCVLIFCASVGYNRPVLIAVTGVSNIAGLLSCFK